MKTMNPPPIGNHLRVALKHSALALAAALGLATGGAQAGTTTQTFELGTSPAKTTIQPGVSGLLPWIAKGSLPPGSILRSVSVNAVLESVDGGAGDDWASDLCVYFDPVPETPGTAALLQVGGYGTIGTVTLALTDLNGNGWANGQGGPPTPVSDTMLESDWTAVGAVDLSTVEVSVGNDYSEASWSGTITVEYEVSVLGVTLTSPADTQAYPTDTSITATATAVDPNTALTDTVTFHTTRTDLPPPYTTVDTPSTDTSSPFSAVLGTLPEGTYEIYATVTNNDTPPGIATSATHTFTVAPAQSTTTTLGTTNPSTYGQSVTFTATVDPVPSGGTVQFKADSVNIGSPVAVNTGDGTASFSTSALAVAGPNSITADFSGHGVYLASAATAVTQTVDKAPLTVTALNLLRAPNTPNPDPLPYQITGYQNGEDLDSSGVGGTPALTTEADLDSIPGDYIITCAIGGLLASNYDFTSFVDAILTVAEVADTFSVNFYTGTGPVQIPTGVPAGFNDWFTPGWLNFDVPWSPTEPQNPVTLTSNNGSSATFTLIDTRNGGITQDPPRTTNLADGNYSLMAALAHGTSVEGEEHKFDIEVKDIPFDTYDVIFYMGSSSWNNDRTGKIVFNGAPERAFTLQAGSAYTGTFTEMVDGTTPGNYIVYTGVTGSSFTAQVYGDGFNHLGVTGFQIREATAGSGYNAWATTNSVSGGVNGDSNNDGMQNGIAYFMNDTGLITNPGVTANTVTWPNGGKILAADYGTQFVVQTSPDLVNWTDVPSGDGNLSNTDTLLTYTLPSGAVGGKLFVRLLVTPTL